MLYHLTSQINIKKNIFLAPPTPPAAARHRPPRCSFGSDAGRVWACKRAVCLARARPPASTMLIVLQALLIASEYIYLCLMHPQMHARTHARFLLLSNAIPHIHATTTTNTALIPTRCLCSSVRSV